MVAMTTAAESDLVKEAARLWAEAAALSAEGRAKTGCMQPWLVVGVQRAKMAFDEAAQALADRVKELTFAGEQMMETLKGHQAEISRLQASNAEMRSALTHAGELLSAHIEAYHDYESEAGTSGEKQDLRGIQHHIEGALIETEKNNGI